MAMRFILSAVVALSACVCQMDVCAAVLNVSQVEISKEGAVTPGLEGVAAIINRTFGYSGCKLIDQQSCVLPANATLNFRDGYKLIFRALGEDKVSVTIMNGKKQLLSTSVSLGGTAPVIIGGFSNRTGDSKRIFVLKKSE